MLVEEGFDVVSVDASDKMLKYALKSRWERRKEPAFDQWGMVLLFCLLSRIFSRLSRLRWNSATRLLVVLN